MAKQPPEVHYHEAQHYQTLASFCKFAADEVRAVFALGLTKLALNFVAAGGVKPPDLIPLGNPLTTLPPI